VCDLRLTERIAVRLILEPAIGAGQPILVLAQVFGPGADL
jgi:hypothetical protein